MQILNNNQTYIIGEIGQNHNGSVEIIKSLIDFVAKPVHDLLFKNDLPGLNAIKLTKRDLENEMTFSQMQQIYNSPNSFGKTYGEHRQFLELSNEQHFECYRYAKENGLDFIETLCAPNCLNILKLFSPDKLKVASRDLTNLPLLEALAETEIPIILSTGMASEIELDDALNIVSKRHNSISILHCVSEYPTQYKNVNLNTIKYLQTHYSNYVIGYSDHTIGIATPLAAVAMGAKIIEKHITLDRQMKGTDQIGSLGLDGIYRMVRDIRNLEAAFGDEIIKIEDAVLESSRKLERSIAAKYNLPVGHIITETDITLLSPGDGYKWKARNELIGKKLISEIPKGELIYSKHFK